MFHCHLQNYIYLGDFFFDLTHLQFERVLFHRPGSLTCIAYRVRVPQILPKVTWITTISNYHHVWWQQFRAASQALAGKNIVYSMIWWYGFVQGVHTQCLFCFLYLSFYHIPVIFAAADQHTFSLQGLLMVAHSIFIFELIGNTTPIYGLEYSFMNLFLTTINYGQHLPPINDESLSSISRYFAAWLTISKQTHNQKNTLTNLNWQSLKHQQSLASSRNHFQS